MKKQRRPLFFKEFKNIGTWQSGYQVAVTRNKKENSKHLPGQSPAARKAAERWRDRMLQLLPAKRKNAIRRKVLAALGLKEPVVGVSYHPRRRMFQVPYRSGKGRRRTRSFHWSDPGREVAAYSAAVKFRKSLLKKRR